MPNEITLGHLARRAHLLRGQMADADWNGKEANEIELLMLEISAGLDEMPLTQEGTRFTLEYRMARAAAEALNPAFQELKKVLSKRSECELSQAELESAAFFATRVRAVLGAFIVLADGL